MKTILNYILVFICTFTYAQNTVGVISQSEGVYDGYTIVAPLGSNKTYLINNCGEIVHNWEASTYTPSASVYLLENGNLLKTGDIPNNEITFGGVGGKIEMYDWDDNLIWEYTLSSPTESLHHDIYPLPNGNILVLVVTTITEAEALANGRRPDLITENKIFNEQILELQPIGSNQANIVWQWNIKDHLVQDYDNTKNNFGIVENNPQLLDFNYAANGQANWLHINSIQYNETLDQIILSSRLNSEIYIIDHSTTTLEAASHSGGTYNKGGDFLYRWGNNEAYGLGDSTTKKLFGQHYPYWIDEGFEDAGKIMIFNNGVARGFSSVDIINPTQTGNGIYAFTSSNGFSPLNHESTIVSDNNLQFTSGILSSGQRLPNGNTLICAGASGKYIEVNNANDIVWEYINPDTNNGILNQGDTPSANFVFRGIKYSKDYSAFLGRDLTPSNTIENNTSGNNCTLLNKESFEKNDLSIYPNPTSDIINIITNQKIKSLTLFSLDGKRVKNVKSVLKKLDVKRLEEGIYVINFVTENGKTFTKKMIKI